jgi:hypothetical protein
VSAVLSTVCVVDGIGPAIQSLSAASQAEHASPAGRGCERLRAAFSCALHHAWRGLRCRYSNTAPSGCLAMRRVPLATSCGPSRMAPPALDRRAHLGDGCDDNRCQLLGRRRRDRAVEEKKRRDMGAMQPFPVEPVGGLRTRELLVERNGLLKIGDAHVREHGDDVRHAPHRRKVLTCARPPDARSAGPERS